MDFEGLERLIEIFEGSGLTEIEIEEEGRRMRLQKIQPVGPATIPVQSAAPAEVKSPLTPHASDDAADDGIPEGLETIVSPMVGTFYAASAPGEPSFVEVGDQLEENQTVCIVEAMKLMNEVAAKIPCCVEKILVENGQPVEFGQALFAVRALG